MAFWTLPDSPSRTSDTELAYASPKTTIGADEESIPRHLEKQKEPNRALRDEDGKLGPDGWHSVTGSTLWVLKVYEPIKVEDECWVPGIPIGPPN